MIPVVSGERKAVPSQLALPALEEEVASAYRRRGSVEDFRLLARKRLPKAIFDFIDGAAGREVTSRANVEDFARYRFLPRVLTDLEQVDLSTTVLGRTISTPIMLAPAGGQRLACERGELDAVRAAARFGTVFALAVGASHTIEEVADAGAGASLWFQLYFWGDRGWSKQILKRVGDAGYDALCVTIDTKTPTDRQYRSVRNGIAAMPESLGPGTLVDAWRKPGWLRGYRRGGPIRTVNDPVEASPRAARAFTHTYDPRATWDELRWLRSEWSGPLVVKGVLAPEDAELAYACGADAVICSNHGGRMLDGIASTISVLPRLVEVAQRLGKEIYLDGGIRTGGDVVKALSLGASACLIGRPYWWGLAAGGEAGVSAVLGLLSREVRSAMTQLGARDLGELHPGLLQDIGEGR